MAQTFTYSIKAAIPLPPGVMASANYDTSMSIVEFTGPKSSVSDGMTIADVTDDWTTMIGLVEVEGGGTGYQLRFDAGTSNAASTAEIVVVDRTDGAVLTGDTDLSSTTWTCLVFGAGAEASKLDL